MIAAGETVPDVRDTPSFTFSDHRGPETPHCIAG